MSYTPTEWNTGDIISSEKLNKLEAGVEQAIELPDTTGASDGDVLTLAEQDGPVALTTVIPEQTKTLTIDEVSAVLTVNDALYGLVEDDAISLTVNGDTVTGTVQTSELGGLFVEETIGDITVDILIGDMDVPTELQVFQNGEDKPGTYTVKMEAVVASKILTPQWAAPSGGALVVNITTTGGAETLDKTYAEIVPFAPNVWFKEETEGVNTYGILVAIGYADDMYMVGAYSPLASTPTRMFAASSEDGVLTTT